MHFTIISGTWKAAPELCRLVLHSCPALPDLSFGIWHTDRRQSTDEQLSSDDDCNEFGMSSDKDEDEVTFFLIRKD